MNNSILIFVILLMFTIVSYIRSDTKVFTKEEEEKLSYMYYLLNTVTNTLQRHNISHYIDCGTLLGCIREGGLLLHDTDVDVTIHLDDWEKLKNIDFAEVDLIKTRESSDEKTAKLVSVKIAGKQLYCDIYANPAFPKLETRHMRNVTGKRKKYNVPENSELYLSILYGDWRTPSGKHAQWPNLFYIELPNSEYKKHWDPKYKMQDFY